MSPTGLTTALTFVAFVVVHEMVTVPPAEGSVSGDAVRVQVGAVGDGITTTCRVHVTLTPAPFVAVRV